MSKQYHRVMDRLEVTGEMESRILARVQQAELIPAPAQRGVFLRHVLPLCACLALVLVCAAALPRPQGQPAEQPLRPPVAVPNPIMTAADAGELSALVGFAVEVPEALPFTPEEITYAALQQSTAEIVCISGEQCAIFRKSAGMEDNSGRYDPFGSVVQLDSGVTLKGSGEVYTLAVWTDGSFSYSLSLSAGTEAAVWENILAPYFSES